MSLSHEVPSHGTQMLEQVHKIICNLAMPRIDRSEIAIRRSPWTKNVIYQGCTVWAVPQIYAAGTNEREDVGYGAAITFAAYDSQDASSNIDQIPIWIATSRSRFLYESRLDITPRSGCSFINLTIHSFDPRPPRNHPESEKYEMQSLIVRAWVRESRIRG